jgi:uncharacterized protein YjdB
MDVKIYPSVSVLKVGETQQLTAIVSPDNADDKSVKWAITALHPIDTSKGQDVVSISESGKVTGITEGFARIVCITNNLFLEATADVIVGYAAAVAGIYHGSLSKDGIVIDSINASMALVRTDEDKAQLYYYPAPGVTISCDVEVKHESGKMMFSGTSGGVIPEEPIVEASGAVTLDGIGEFEVVVSYDGAVTTYSFFGKKDTTN